MIPIANFGTPDIRFSQFVIGKQTDGITHLCFEAFAKKGYVLYMGVLFPLNDTEILMDGGRFLNFDKTLDTNPVYFAANATSDILAGGVTYGEYGEFVQQMVEWCAAQTHGTTERWGFKIEAHTTSLMGNHFFFSDASMAVHFKLLWA